MPLAYGIMHVYYPVTHGKPHRERATCFKLQPGDDESVFFYSSL